LRRGQHIPVDILLRTLPPRIGWELEWIRDILGLACPLYFLRYRIKVLSASYLSNPISIQTMVVPEVWLLAPMPLACVVVSIEFLFRMQRLAMADRAPRSDAVSVS